MFDFNFFVFVFRKIFILKNNGNIGHPLAIDCNMKLIISIFKNFNICLCSDTF